MYPPIRTLLQQLIRPEVLLRHFRTGFRCEESSSHVTAPCGENDPYLAVCCVRARDPDYARSALKVLLDREFQSRSCPNIYAWRVSWRPNHKSLRCLKCVPRRLSRFWESGVRLKPNVDKQCNDANNFKRNRCRRLRCAGCVWHHEPRCRKRGDRTASAHSQHDRNSSARTCIRSEPPTIYPPN